MSSNNANSNAPSDKANGLAIAGFSVSLFGVLFGGLLFGLVGGVLGFFGYRKHSDGETTKGKGLSIAAMIMGAIVTAQALVVLGNMINP
jgi:hypothetical protein